MCILSGFAADTASATRYVSDLNHTHRSTAVFSPLETLDSVYADFSYSIRAQGVNTQSFAAIHWESDGETAIAIDGFVENRETRLLCDPAPLPALLRLIRAKGLRSVVETLHGQFTIMYFEPRSRRVSFARDRSGSRRLYLKRLPSGIAFSTTMTGLLSHVPLGPNRQTILAFLFGHGGPMFGASFFEDVWIPPPGSLTTYESSGAITTERVIGLSDYWDPDLHRELESMSESKVIDRCQALVTDAIADKLRHSSTAVAFCSGGLDSAVMIGIASKLSRSSLTMVHADIQGSYSERPEAELLSRQLGLNLLVEEIAPVDFITMIPELVLSYEYPPWYHSNALPYLRLCSRARALGASSVLSGEGADECFTGFDEKTIVKAAQSLKSALVKVRHLIGAHSRKLLALAGLVFNEDWDNIDRVPPKAQYQLLCEMLTGFEREGEVLFIKEHLRAQRGLDIDPLDVMNLRIFTYHHRSLLYRNECVSASRGVFSEYPFLDSSVVRFSVNLPYRYKSRFTPFRIDFVDPRLTFIWDKWVLRQLAGRVLPKNWRRRKKWGFLTGAYSRCTVSEKLFVDGLVQSHLGLSRSQLNQLYSRADVPLKTRMMFLEVWGRMFFAGFSADEARALVHRTVLLPRGEG